MGFSIRKLSRRMRLPVPKGVPSGWGKAGKIISALGVGPVLGPINPLSMDPEVLGARASASGGGTVSVDEAKADKIGEAREAEVVRQAEERAAADAAQSEAQRLLLEEEEQRRRLRSAATGGFASTVLSGGGGGGTGGASSGAAGRRLYGS